MNLRYFFSVFAVILFLSSGVKASDRSFLQRETPFIISLNISGADLFANEQVSPLLNKVIVLAHSENHVVFWKNVKSFFEKVGLVYANLWRYLYASIFSIFR
ncbi:hypothetical protein [Bartonella gliris]|uniref:hypothetical protein n=1 Tax=Bartonella gliris TaxID=3004109 RepID=UPI00295E769F|nr:hypothetical protein [Bartonella gliris]